MGTLQGWNGYNMHCRLSMLPKVKLNLCKIHIQNKKMPKISLMGEMMRSGLHVRLLQWRTNTKDPKILIALVAVLNYHNEQNKPNDILIEYHKCCFLPVLRKTLGTIEYIRNRKGQITQTH